MSEPVSWASFVLALVLAVISGPATKFIRQRISKRDEESSVVRDALALTEGQRGRITALERQVLLLEERNETQGELIRTLRQENSAEISMLRDEILKLRTLMRDMQGGSLANYYQLLANDIPPTFNPNSIEF